MFVSMLLSAVFGDDVLKESSAGGSKSNYNDVSHNALECNKLKFIKGIIFLFKWHIVQTSHTFHITYETNTHIVLIFVCRLI